MSAQASTPGTAGKVSAAGAAAAPPRSEAGRSEALFERARAVSPGGVHSPVRAFRGVGGTPVFMTGGAGALLRDVDEREYVDYCMAFGPLILGHGNPAVRTAAEAALARGWSLGTAEPYSLALAEFIVERIPWVQSVRFVNSGTEAVMSALRVARAATGRAKILKFEGCYHGHADSMLLRAGSGLAEAPVPDSAGLAPEVVRETLIAPLDDLAALETMFAQHGREIAAAIIEPLPANFGLLPQRPEFLQALARLTRAHGALLIFDEVISGFRIGFGGYAAGSGIEPDLVTYGKIIGGGFPVGAYGGRRDLMQQVAPAGPVYQAGTLSANPLAMSAGLAALRELADGHVYEQLESLGQRLEQRLAALPQIHLQRVGSIFWLCLGAPRPAATDASGRSPDAAHVTAPLAGTPSAAAGRASPMRSPAAFPDGAGARYAAIYRPLLERGIYLAPSAFEVGFLSAAHTPAHIDALADALEAVLNGNGTEPR